MSMKRRRGRSRKGKIAQTIVAAEKGPNHSVYAAIIPEFGLLHYMIKKGKYKSISQSQAFADFVRECCVKMQEKGIDWKCCFIMDNAAFHKSELITPVLREFGHFLKFNPRYTPDFNPIENCFSFWKAPIKRSYVASNVQLVRLIHKCSRAVTPGKTKRCFDHVLNVAFPKALEFEDF